ncbi:MAG TPA: hypothetical protein VGO81_07315, partial [Solirubrobacteraceae bacterium]|nr:hypothetical protein [Solirubrobacteraceae bacterium]
MRAHSRLPRALRHEVAPLLHRSGDTARRPREQHEADKARDVADADEESTLLLSCWTYLGCAYLNPGDALLAAGVEA